MGSDYLSQTKEELRMDAVWWIPGILAIVFYTLWAAGAFKKKPARPADENRV
jgi:hypothetical protein